MKLCVPFTEDGEIAFVADDQGYFGLATKGKRKDRAGSWEQFCWFPHPDQALRYALEHELAHSDADSFLDLIEDCNGAFARLGARITAALEQIGGGVNAPTTETERQAEHLRDLFYRMIEHDRKKVLDDARELIDAEPYDRVSSEDAG